MAFESELDDIIDSARRNGTSTDPAWRQRLAQAWIEVRLLAIANQRKMTTLLRGDGTLGPESSIAKLYWAGMHQRLSSLAVDVLGPAALAGESHPQDDTISRTFLYSRCETIYGGSDEIQRNTLAERVLGLPKEPRA